MHNNVDNDGGASREEIDDPNAACDPSIVAAKGDDSEVKSFELAPEFSAGGSQVCVCFCYIHDEHLILLPIYVLLYSTTSYPHEKSVSETLLENFLLMDWCNYMQ